MANIELVIKISEELYDIIINPQKLETMYHAGKICEAVRNGTSLPKGHGRLIDADALYNRAKLCHTEEDGTACVEWREINDAPTIIEADEEEDQ